MKRVSFVSARFAAACLLAVAYFACLTPNNLFAQQAAAKPESALDLGNPSKAKPDPLTSDNYLVIHGTYILSYNRSRGAANWVAWHLTRSDIGSIERTNAFAPDTALPKDWWIKPTDYTGSGYDRGHLCPSKDRSSSEETNKETFFMSNMQPQTPKLNQKTWKYLEDYTRETVKDNEAYIYAGCYGDGGRIKDKITVPTNCFKIIVVLAEGEKDLKRINKLTRIIAVDMPNGDSLSSRWRTYLTTVDEIEKRTKYDFLSAVPKKIQAVIEAKKDTEAETKLSETKPTGAKPVDTKTSEPTKKIGSDGRTYVRGSRGGCYYINENGNKVYVKDKSLCGN